MKNLDELQPLRKQVLLALPNVNKSQIESVYNAADTNKAWDHWNEFFITTLLASGNLDMSKEEVIPYKTNNIFKFPPVPLPDTTWNLLTGTDVAKILARNNRFSCPYGFETINFSEQRFNLTWDMQDWKDAMRAVPATTKSLILSGNKMTRLKVEEIQQIAAVIPPTVDVGLRAYELSDAQQRAFVSK